MPSLLVSSLRLPRHLLPVHPDKGPWEPTPPQAAFLLLSRKEALYGGAAGGGKSDALLVAALQYVYVPGYAALILRRSFSDLSLPDAIMSRAKGWLIGRPGVTWSEKGKTFYFDTGPGNKPATLTFGFLQRPDDHLRYQGAAFQFIAFDELTQFIEAHYRYLFSRLRKPAEMAVPLRMRAATNPGGPGHEWVKARFGLDPEHRQINEHRAFIPAKLSDNPHLDQESYEASLAELGPIERARLLAGDWGVRPPGEMFDRIDVQTIDLPDGMGSAPVGTRWFRRWDFASTEKRKKGQEPDWSVGALVGRTPDDRIIVCDIRRFRADPGETEARVKQTAEQDGKGVVIRIEKEPGSAGAFVIDQFVRALYGWTVEGLPSTGSKTERARPYASYWKAHKVYVRLGASWVETFLAEHEAFPQESIHDDQVDAVSQAFADLGGIVAPASVTIAPSYARGDAGAYHSSRGSLGRR